MASPSPPEKPRGWPATPTGPALKRPSRGRDPSAAERGSLPTRSSTVGEARLSRAAAAPGAALDARTTGYVTVPTAESEGKAEVRGASQERRRRSLKGRGRAGGRRGLREGTGLAGALGTAFQQETTGGHAHRGQRTRSESREEAAKQNQRGVWEREPRGKGQR